MGFYLGAVTGVILALLVIRYLTAFRFIMALLVLGGVAIAALAGFFLAWPVRGHFEPVYGALAGAIIGSVIYLRPLISSRPA